MKMRWNEDIPDAGGGERWGGEELSWDIDGDGRWGWDGDGMGMMGKGISRVSGERHATCW